MLFPNAECRMQSPNAECGLLPECRSRALNGAEFLRTDLSFGVSRSERRARARDDDESVRFGTRPVRDASGTGRNFPNAISRMPPRPSRMPNAGIFPNGLPNAAFPNAGGGEMEMCIIG